MQSEFFGAAWLAARREGAMAGGGGLPAGLPEVERATATPRAGRCCSARAAPSSSTTPRRRCRVLPRPRTAVRARQPRDCVAQPNNIVSPSARPCACSERPTSSGGADLQRGEVTVDGGHRRASRPAGAKPFAVERGDRLRSRVHAENPEFLELGQRDRLDLSGFARARTSPVEASLRVRYPQRAALDETGWQLGCICPGRAIYLYHCDRRMRPGGDRHGQAVHADRLPDPRYRDDRLHQPGNGAGDPARAEVGIRRRSARDGAQLVAQSSAIGDDGAGRNAARPGRGRAAAAELRGLRRCAAAARLFRRGRHLLPMLALTLFVGLLGGLYPALHLSAFRPEQVLKAATVTGGGGSSRLRTALVVAQFAISIGSSSARW